MCRLYGFRANEPTKVECSLVHAQNALLRQSRKDHIGRAHADGWGLASYENGTLTVEKRQAAAYEDLHFSETAERIYATTVVAHVRRATVGGPATWNTHPFHYGRWVFAHNGTVARFDAIEGRLASETAPRFQGRRDGTTDSEQCFYWLLTQMALAGVDPERECDDADAVASVVASALPKLDEEGGSKLNFLLTNGRVLVASRYHNDLYWLERDGVRDCEICGIPHVHHESATSYRAVAVGSEPITHEEWREVPDEHVLSVSPRLSVELRRILPEHRRGETRAFG